MLSVRGSFIGIGTDLGGSIHYPANACGLYGFKPTPKRVSLQGLSLPFLERNGQNDIPVTLGPMGRCVDDLALVCEAWWVEKMLVRGPLCTPKPFDRQTYLHGRSSVDSAASTSDPSPRCAPLRRVFPDRNWFEPIGSSPPMPASGPCWRRRKDSRGQAWRWCWCRCQKDKMLGKPCAYFIACWAQTAPCTTLLMVWKEKHALTTPTTSTSSLRCLTFCALSWTDSSISRERSGPASSTASFADTASQCASTGR